MDGVSLDLLKCVLDNQKDFVVIFHNNEVILTNKSFNLFFGISSVSEYNSNFGDFIDNFVPHPYYFHREKLVSNESWFEAILKLEYNDRIVSMINQQCDPHAFSINIDESILNYKIVTFSDITQDLIKRIMIENNANMDTHSGAYAKKYFQQISRSYQDAALFNEKIIATILITLKEENKVSFNEFVSHFKYKIRKDDMLIRWSDNSFLIVYLADSQENAQKMLQKLEKIILDEPIEKFQCLLKIAIQNDKESIKSLISRIL